MNQHHSIRFLLIFAIALLSATSTIRAGTLTIHPLFQTNMVMQRDKPLTIWGQADPESKITAQFAGKEGAATATKDGTWRITLPAMPANSSPQTMTIQGADQSITLDNILIGDIWILGGQSNMQHPLSNVEEGTVEIASANFPDIRLLTIPQVIDHTTKHDFPRRLKGKQPDGDWDVCSPKTVPEFSAIGYIFGRRIHMATRIPIGLIDASQFGTTVEAWMPLELFKSIDSEAVRELQAEWDKKVAAGWDAQKDLDQRIKQHQARMADLAKQGKPANAPPPSDLRLGPIDNQNYPGNCYASMIAPIAGFALKGAVWHQGFNNAREDAATFYYQVFPRMIESWRAAFHDPKMPFGIVSLCTDDKPQTLENYNECMFNMGIYVREAHYKVFLDAWNSGDKNIGFASSFDLRRAWYHPQQKIPAGERIARWAMATQYGFEKFAFWKPPFITGMEAKDGSLVLRFDREVDSEDSHAIAGFAIAGDDKKFQPAEATHEITGKDARGNPTFNKTVLILRSPHVAMPVHYRYGWGRNPLANVRIANTAEKDVPLAPQRSDSWAFWEVPYLAAPADKTKTKPNHDQIRDVLKFTDLERRILDAQRLLEREKPRYEEWKMNFR